VHEPGNGARHVYGFGMGGISKWDISQNGVRYQGSSSSLPSYEGVPLPARAFKTSGVVLNESTLLVSDSAGFMLVLLFALDRVDRLHAVAFTANAVFGAPQNYMASLSLARVHGCRAFLPGLFGAMVHLGIIFLHVGVY